MTLYLKYRPQDFDSLVWQDFIAQTLKIAISQSKTVWAYLFTGPRGTGKTSTARIFAKAINCQDIKEGNPCLSCEICESFHDGNLIDVIEIDAASHTGVDNIREIIEQAQFAPTHASKKIYIIDEVHMLSKWAFNALLKILEEPPAHIVFILATTEIQKVPETILSRCQRYDFRSIDENSMRARLEYIANSEVLEVDDASYDYIVTRSNGWLRNAITLFEQLIQDGKISYERIVETLWVTSNKEYEIFLQKLLERDQSILSDIENLQSSGKNAQYFMKDFSYYVLAEIKELLKKQSDISAHIAALELLDTTSPKLRHSFDPFFTLSVAFMAYMQPWSDVPAVAMPMPKPEAKVQAQTIAQKPVEEASPIVTPEPELSAESVSDIFSDAPSLPEPSPSIGIQFDASWYIAAVKSLGAKAALIMSLKSADFSIHWETLCITWKTTIAKNTLSKSENFSLLQTAAESQWYNTVKSQ